MPLTFLQYITPSRLAGAEYFFLRVIAHLAEKGHRVIVVTKRDTPLRAEIEKFQSPNIVLHAWHTHGKIDPVTLAKLCRLVRDERVDVINTHLTTASWQGALAGKLCGVPSVAVVHATDRKTWFQHADRLIAVSGGVKKALIEQGIAPDSNRGFVSRHRPQTIRRPAAKRAGQNALGTCPPMPARSALRRL